MRPRRKAPGGPQHAGALLGGGEGLAVVSHSDRAADHPTRCCSGVAEVFSVVIRASALFLVT